jgi:hypothetical protein
MWVSSRRLPMMHRFGWDGPRATSNTCYAWFIWDRRGTPAPPGMLDGLVRVAGKCRSLALDARYQLVTRYTDLRKFLDTSVL